jgi:hypothetical protein
MVKTLFSLYPFRPGIFIPWVTTSSKSIMRSFFLFLLFYFCYFHMCVLCRVR